jgi:F-type H+-transporting ATPase subunit a
MDIEIGPTDVYQPITHPFFLINPTTIRMSWYIMIFLTLLVILVRVRLKTHPGRLQVMLETIVGAFDSLCKSTLGDRGRKYLPFIGSLFLFVWLSNICGIIPIMEEPTKDANTPIGLMIIAILTAHISAIRLKGIKEYVKEYFEPAFRIRGIWIPNVLFAPLNIVGEFGKAISMAFRLFGNIFGGGIIVLVISSLVSFVGLPPFLNLFLGLFSGTVQAFVFSMLALTYTAVATS